MKMSECNFCSLSSLLLESTAKRKRSEFVLLFSAIFVEDFNGYENRFICKTALKVVMIFIFFLIFH